MKKPAFLLVILIIAALPAAAQNTSEFGLLLGGTKLINDVPNTQGQTNVNNFKFSNSVKEVYWGVQMEPGTTPTFTASAQASIMAWAPDRVATLPPITSSLVFALICATTVV